MGAMKNASLIAHVLQISKPSLHLHLKLIKLGHFGQLMLTLFNLSLPIYRVGIKILKDYSQV